MAPQTASKTTLRPLGDRALVKPLPREEVTKTGIVLPDTAKEKPQEGLVLAVGPGPRLDNGQLEPMPIKVGDRVLYAGYAGTELKLDNEDHLILRESDLLAVLES
ncbi:MAG: co-chaperone GroES [Chloroflexi bacterium]|nr:co-chaperone GroES [Chloroflexota bacterium]